MVLVGTLALAPLSPAVATSARRGTAKTVLRTYKGSAGLQLVTSQRLTLYAFSRDNGKSRCYGRCQKTWLPLIAHGKVVAASGSHVQQAKLGTVRRANGQLQVTYNRQPVYQYRSDTRPGQTKGANQYQYGGDWEVMGASGSTLPPGGYP